MAEPTWNGVQASMRCWWCREPIGEDSCATIRYGVIHGRSKVGVPMHGLCEGEWSDWDADYPIMVRRRMIPECVSAVIGQF